VTIRRKNIPKKSAQIIQLNWSEIKGFNGRLAVFITNAVSTMWCAYIFAGIALVSLPTAMQSGTSALITWVTQTFLQLVLLSVIMVGQKVAAKASDRRAIQTYKDAEKILQLNTELRELAMEIRSMLVK